MPSPTSFPLACFHWVPGYSDLPGNKLTDSLAKTGGTLPFVHVPSLLAPVTAKRWQLLCYLETKSFSQFFPLVSSEKLDFPASPALHNPDFVARCQHYFFMVFRSLPLGHFYNILVVHELTFSNYRAFPFE